MQNYERSMKQNLKTFCIAITTKILFYHKSTVLKNETNLFKWKLLTFHQYRVDDI